MYCSLYADTNSVNCLRVLYLLSTAEKKFSSVLGFLEGFSMCL